MSKQLQPQRIFEQIKQVDADGNEFWSARTLAKTLLYTDYRNFVSVIAKAKKARRNIGQQIVDHFEDILEMVNDKVREVRDGRFGTRVCQIELSGKMGRA